MWISEAAPSAFLAWFFAAAAPAPSTPTVIVVPPALAKSNATIEPSGIVWASALSRYLVVSDDTGQKEDRHAPFVLALSTDGRFDEEPVPLVGVDELNDAEAICAGPVGTFFLTTSHSPNHRGKTRPARRMLLHLALEGRRLKVLGRIDLTEARAANGGDLLALAGLPPGRLDIEGLTYREDALFIGLKSPLLPDGRAVLLRLVHPVAQLAQGRVLAGELSRVGALALKVPSPRPGAASEVVAQGIADLAALPNGDFLVAGNAPKGGPSDGGGGVYLYHSQTGETVLLRRFPGLKPEGIAQAADGQSWVVVFDNDVKPPLWVTLPPLASPLAAGPGTTAATAKTSGATP